jgi:hypothetical protein
LRVLRDAEGVLDLIEFAVTWGELGYSERAFIPPNRWAEFAHAHSAWTATPCSRLPEVTESSARQYPPH